MFDFECNFFNICFFKIIPSLRFYFDYICFFNKKNVLPYNKILILNFCMLFLFALGSIYFDYSGRVDIWKKFFFNFDRSLTSWIFGEGGDTLKKQNFNFKIFHSSFHNSYLSFFYERGVLGLLFISSYLTLSLVQFRKKYKYLLGFSTIFFGLSFSQF